jgi:hypothetical protein
MKPQSILLAALLASAPAAQTNTAWAGNTSSNSSSNTSSNSSSNGSSYVHTHRWSVDSDDGRRRRIDRGTTRIERYAPAYGRYDRGRYDRARRGRDRDDD